MPARLHAIEFGRRAIADYEPIAGADAVEEARALAAPLAGLRVLHLVPADPAARAPELLATLLPLLDDAGVDVAWRVVAGGAGALRVARGLADGIRGGETAFDAADWSAFRDAWSAAVGAAGEWDVVVAHEAAGVAVAAARARRPALGHAPGAAAGPALVWRLHVDASHPDEETWERLAPLARELDACVVPLDSFAPPLEGVARHAVAPAIDPFGPRNRELPIRLAGDALRLLGVDLDRPLCCQVGVLDPWSDPHAVLDAFALARERVPELQLVLAGGPLGGGADAWRLAGELGDYAGGVAGVHVLTGYAGVGDLELNALERLARVALVSTLRDDFALDPAAALWKGTPVVAQPRGAVGVQVREGVDGHLAEGADEIAERVVELVSDPARAIEMGAAGRARVRERFLAPRALADELRLLAELAGAAPRAGGEEDRDATVER